MNPTQIAMVIEGYHKRGARQVTDLHYGIANTLVSLVGTQTEMTELAPDSMKEFQERLFDPKNFFNSVQAQDIVDRIMNESIDNIHDKINSAFELLNETE